MSGPTERHERASKRVLMRLPGEHGVTIRRDVPYADGDARTMDIYYPPEVLRAGSTPIAIIVAGYPDAGFERVLGCRFKEMESVVSWGMLIAATGIIAVSYANREPVADLQALLACVRERGPAFDMDPQRIGVWASSGNVPLALSLLMKDAGTEPRCAVLCYGYMLDLDGATGVAEAASTLRFANPCSGRSVSDLAQEVPLLIARAGRDETANLNDTLDRFVTHALRASLPITLVNHATGPHAFDIEDDSEATRAAVRQVLGFMRLHLRLR